MSISPSPMAATRGALLLSGGADILLAGPEVPIYIFNGKSPLKMVVFCALRAPTDFPDSRKKLDHFDCSRCAAPPSSAGGPAARRNSFSNT